MKIIGFCNPLLDISAIVPRAFLEKYHDSHQLEYDLNENDVVIATSIHNQLYKLKDVQSNFEVEYIAGGSGQNALRAAQLLLEDKSCAIVGSVGRDYYSRILEGKAEEEGLEVLYQKQEDFSTGRCVCLISSHSKNRSLVAFLDAATAFSPSHLLDPKVYRSLLSSLVIYVTGFFLAASHDSGTLSVILDCFNDILSTGPKLLAVNLSAGFVCQKCTDSQFSKIFHMAKLIVGNREEVVVFAQSFPDEILQSINPGEIRSIIARISEIFEKADIIITDGSRPILWGKEGRISEIAVNQLAQDKIVDTNGAGDAFVGGLLASLINGCRMDNSIRIGSFIASLVIQQSGVKFPPKQLVQSHCALKHKELPLNSHNQTYKDKS